jgi:hypothetical protein
MKSKLRETGAGRQGGKRLKGALSVRSAAACALCAVLAACGGAAGGLSRGPAADLEVRDLYRCGEEGFPAEMPALEALVDTARLSAGVLELARAAEVPSARVVLSLWFDETGLNIRRDLIAHDVAPALADSIQELVFQSLRRGPAMERPWGARLTLAAGRQVGYALHRRQYCPPRPRSRVLQAEMEGFMGTGTRYRGGRRESTVLMQVKVHPAGWVEDARVLRGAATGGTLEQRLRDEVRQYSFVPASLDGIPVAGEVAVPVRVRG